MTTGLIDLKTLERNAFRTFYDDGLMDVYLGTMLVVMGLGSLIADRIDNEPLSMLAMLGLAVAFTVPLLIVRRSLLRSRLGDFQPGPERRRRIKGTRLVLIGSVLVGVVTFGVATALHQSGASEDTFAALLPVIWFVNATVVLGAGAYFLDVPRFYAYGVIFGLAMPLLIWPDLWWDYKIPPWIAFGVPGAVVAAVGLYKLVEFLRSYPAHDETVHGQG